MERMGNSTGMEQKETGNGRKGREMHVCERCGGCLNIRDSYFSMFLCVLYISLNSCRIFRLLAHHSRPSSRCSQFAFPLRTYIFVCMYSILRSLGSIGEDERNQAGYVLYCTYTKHHPAFDPQKVTRNSVLQGMKLRVELGHEPDFHALEVRHEPHFHTLEV